MKVRWIFMVVCCCNLGVGSTLDAITIFNDLYEVGEAPPEFYMHAEKFSEPDFLTWLPGLQACVGNRGVSLSYLSWADQRQVRRKMWLMDDCGNSCIFVSGGKNLSPLGLYLAVWSPCFSLTVTYCIYYSCGGEMTSTVCISSYFIFSSQLWE